MTMIYPPEDEIVGYYLKMMIDKRNEWPSNFLRSEDVYCVNPRTHFNTQEPLILHDGRYLFRSLTEQRVLVKPMDVTLVAGGSWVVIN
uniref:NAC domain-containing protein n=1 Tax=Brassica campestris TaxID=3711 RepID=M4ERS1_BRACM